MERIASDAGRTFHLGVLIADEVPDPPFDGEPYPVLVWATRPTTDARKQCIAQALIASGCRYVVCGGVESGTWEDAADDAYLQQDLPDPVPDDRFVMTTSHPGQPEDEVAHFFVRATALHREFSRYLVLLIGADDPVQARLTAAIRVVVAEPHTRV
jgi:hypothetical protein